MRSRSGAGSGRSPYGDQAPNEQSLYDWAPATEEGDVDEMEMIMTELREQQPNTHPDILRVLGRAQLDAQNEMRIQARARSQPSNNAQAANSPQPPQPHEPSLRSAAILQSVRRNRQLSARSRDLMQRYVMDRERAGHETEDRDRSNSSMWFRVAASSNDSHRWELNRLTWQASQRSGGEPSSSTTREARTGETLETLRRRYLEDPCPSPSKFENVIKLLNRLRAPDFDVDDLMKLIKKEYQASRASLETSNLARLTRGLPPPPSSWLAPGTIFSGFQQAAPMAIESTTSSSTTHYRLANSQTISSTTIGPTNLADNRTRSHSATGPAHSGPHDRDRWAVRVAVHAVDYDKMTLQGTMEAFNVPSVPTPQRISALRSTVASNSSPENHASTTQRMPSTADSGADSTSDRPAGTTPHITRPTPIKTTFSTYLEGEILDLNHNTLQTHSFPATPSDDAKYWRRLEPFAHMPDEAIAKALLDPDWLDRELRQKYVLMRWKERCFVRGCLWGREAGDGSYATTSSAVDTVQGVTANGLETIHRVPGDDGIADSMVASSGSGFGLSISGFYYVSLRRRDGRVEGLYFDPASSPYQQLELWPEGGGRCGRGAWDFV